MIISPGRVIPMYHRDVIQHQHHHQYARFVRGVVHHRGDCGLLVMRIRLVDQLAIQYVGWFICSHQQVAVFCELPFTLWALVEVVVNSGDYSDLLPFRTRA